MAEPERYPSLEDVCEGLTAAVTIIERLSDDDYDEYGNIEDLEATVRATQKLAERVKEND